jgi:hypothetical protein
MQFRLRTLLAVITYLSVISALVFAAPPVVAWPLLGLLLLVSPAVWIVGIVYGRGARRAFFIGGTAAGIGPFVATSFVSLMYAVDGLAPLLLNSTSSSISSDDRWTTILVSCLLLSSGPIAMGGGLLGSLVYWGFKEKGAVANSPTSLPNQAPPI